VLPTYAVCLRVLVCASQMETNGHRPLFVVDKNNYVHCKKSARSVFTHEYDYKYCATKTGMNLHSTWFLASFCTLHMRCMMYIFSLVFKQTRATACRVPAHIYCATELRVTCQKLCIYTIRQHVKFWPTLHCDCLCQRFVLASSRYVFTFPPFNLVV
jgi:hypothetical protein